MAKPLQAVPPHRVAVVAAAVAPIVINGVKMDELKLDSPCCSGEEMRAQ
ncbi:MAG: hypothetical protein ONB13_08500 [candidate division KSB1 bacterium]|nr:hypothetical protein [candidate division KSB1 bacterium]MDZ7333914.1 hypothetical protein [candidate division KSB1 bacterium]MDZ7358293.1 hypothetical protein [candidate division KSB1 bacterium]MDZ7376647.1 hypothetical protein [candidate division KSB1 bacterium]MDZ7399160.1 hypothetical protein [candidate division KSB1 bacterium]